jgi:chromosome segregation ATPase
LTASIFLRDKELRRRLNVSLSGAKRRMKRARLGLRLKREKRRRDDLHKELGRAAWIGRVEPARHETFFRDVERIEAEASARQSGLNDARARILGLQTRVEASRRGRKDLEDGGQNPDPHAIHAAKREEAELKREIKALGRRAQAAEVEARRLENEKDGLFRDLGESIDDARLEYPGFVPWYVKIDKINRAILAYMDQIEKLK